MASPTRETDVSEVKDKHGSPKPSPTKHSKAPPPKPPLHDGKKTERPTEPPHPHVLQHVTPEGHTPIGNPDLIFSVKMDGRLGTFYERANTSTIPLLFPFNLNHIRSYAIVTLTEVLSRLIEAREYEPVDVSAGDAELLAGDLASGIAVMTYLKLKYVNSLHSETFDHFRKTPITPEPFEVPGPYALAISQLGKIKVSGTINERTLLPDIRDEDAVRYGLPDNARWNPTKYCRAVDKAKKIGLQFSTVDLSVKMGSAWWLYRPYEDDEFFELQCPVPEENFTEQTALLRMLFVVPGATGNQFDIVDLANADNNNFGTMLRSPPPRMDVLMYNAVTKEADIMWKLA